MHFVTKTPEKTSFYDTRQDSFQDFGRVFDTNVDCNEACNVSTKGRSHVLSSMTDAPFHAQIFFQLKLRLKKKKTFQPLMSPKGPTKRKRFF